MDKCDEKGEFKIQPRYETETKTFRIPVPMAEQLEALAYANNVSVNGLIIQCIQFALQHLDQDTK